MSLPLVLALLVVTGVPAVPESAPPPDALAATLSEARRLIDTGRPADAVARLTELGPGADPRVAELLGVAHFHAGQAGPAAELLRGALPALRAGSLERREAVQVLGLALSLGGRLAEALPYLEETQQALPDNAELGYALGMAYVQTRQAGKAHAAWARAFGLPADSAAAHVMTAQMMVRVEFDDLAEAELKQAIAKDPRVPQARFLLGQTALFRGRLDEAVALLREELALNPGNPLVYDRLGDALIRQGKWDEAIPVLRRSTWINPFSSGPLILLGRAWLKKDDPAAAEGLLRQALQHDPRAKAAHYLLAQALQRLNRLDEARAEFEQAERLPGPNER